MPRHDDINLNGKSRQREVKRKKTNAKIEKLKCIHDHTQQKMPTYKSGKIAGDDLGRRWKRIETTSSERREPYTKTL